MIEQDPRMICDGIRENVQVFLFNILMKQGFKLDRFNVYVSFPNAVDDLDRPFYEVNIEVRGKSRFGDLLWREGLELAPPFFTDADWRGPQVCAMLAGARLERDLKTMAMRHAMFGDLLE